MKSNCFIGLTGGIGTGKSKVSRFWSTYAGLPLIDVDRLCRELLEVDMPGWVALKENLGDIFFSADGRLDRPALRSAIFADDALRQKVDTLIHPLAQELFHKKTEGIDHPVLVDVPLLFEAGWKDQFFCTVVVYADQQTCCTRVVARDNVPPENAAQAIAAQMGIWEKAMLADHVIDNRYGWLRTRMQVVHLARLINDQCCR